MLVRSTRRLLSSALPRLSAALLFAGACAGGVVASCSSDDTSDAVANADASSGTDASPATDATDAHDTPDAPDDGRAKDASSPRDAASPAPLPVACTSEPCATALVTSQGESYCVLLHDGTVACWGDNANLQLGHANPGGGAATASGTATRIAGLSNVVFLEHSCAIDGDGATWCWGKGPYLQSEAGIMTTQTSPVKLPIPPAKAVSVSFVSATQATACALVEDGVLCWGSNGNGQVTVPVLGQAVTVPYPAQAATIPSGAPLRGIALGNAAFALREDGTVVSWGANPPLGRVSSLFPDPYPRPIALTGIANLDVSFESACAVSGGEVYCWGSPATNLSDPIQPLDRALPQPVPMPEPIAQVATIGKSSSTATTRIRGCAVGSSGDLYCWGPNESGEIGDGTENYATTATKVIGLPALVAQVRTTPKATCALLVDGTVYCWGDDTTGQLGNGVIKVPSSVPQKVVLP